MSPPACKHAQWAIFTYFLWKIERKNTLNIIRNKISHPKYYRLNNKVLYNILFSVFMMELCTLMKYSQNSLQFCINIPTLYIKARAMGATKIWMHMFLKMNYLCLVAFEYTFDQ